MAKTLTLTFNNEEKFTRDLDALCEWFNFEQRENQKQDKERFIELRLKEYFQQLSKQHRKNKAVEAIEVED